MTGIGSGSRTWPVLRRRARGVREGRNPWARPSLPLVAVAVAVCASACVRYRVGPVDTTLLERRAQTASAEGLRVTVAVPSDEEARQLFGLNLAEAGIQPVWLEIENATDVHYRLAPATMDPGYFTPREAARRCAFWFGGSANDRMQEELVRREIAEFVPPQGRRSGFVLTRHERGVKVINVDLMGRGRFQTFSFLVMVPGFRADFARLDFQTLYDAAQIRDVDEAQLRVALEQMPACTTTEDGTGTQDPLNFALLGDRRDILTSLLRAGWKVTEVLDRKSAFRTFYSYFFDQEYLHAPVSAVYLFGRRQDLALQKARETARERNHLRMWMTPVRFRGHPVWVGQISRDIGLSYSPGSFLGHVVDPDVDEARNYLVQDLAGTQHMSRFGWVAGVGATRPSAPRYMADGAPFFTDGLRAVMEFAPEWTPLDKISAFDWEHPQPPDERAAP